MTISQRSLAAAVMIYMALSVCLFLCGWFEAYISLPLSLGIATSIYIFFKKSANNVNDEKWHISTSEGVQLVTIFLLIVFCLFKSGLAGVFATHSDYYIFRNGLYHNLIDAPWPVILPDGKEMSYYLSGLLVPAMLSRLTESYLLQQWILLIWSSIPIFLACLLCFCHHKKISWIFIGFGLFSAYFVIWSVPPLGTILKGYQQICSSLFGSCKDNILPYWVGWGWTSSGLQALSCPAMVGLLLATYQNNGHNYIPLAMVLLAFLSPLGALGLFPIALFQYWKSIRAIGYNIWKLSAPLALPLFCTACLWLYHARSQGDYYVGCAALAHGYTSFINSYIPSFCIFTLAFASIIKHCHQRKELVVLYLIIILCPIAFVGSRPSNLFPGYNELCIKSFGAYVLLFSYYLSNVWQKVGSTVRLLWLYWLFLSLFSFAMDTRGTIHNGPHEMKDILNGHLHHPQFAFLNQSCPPCKPPAIPGVMLRKSGESEQLFPGCILPKTPGCDYSRPLNKE